MGKKITGDSGHGETTVTKRCTVKAAGQAAIGCLLCLAALLSWLPPVHASEGGSSYYFPGAFASFAVAVAPDPGYQFVNQSLYYSANVDKAVLHGKVDLSLRATAIYNYFGLFYTPGDTVLGGRFQMGAMIPLGYVHLKAGVEAPSPLPPVHETDREFAVGDSALMGSLFWKTGDFHFKFSEMIFLPTGAYSTNDLANTGRNYVGFDSSFTATWLSSKTGTEVSVMPGIMFNTENNSTDYKTGNEFHMDFMVNQFLAKTFAIGAQGYYYKQVTGDSGDGTRLLDAAGLDGFKGESCGFGPALLWMPGAGGGKLSVIGKWLFDTHHENRMKGDYGQVDISYKF
jgi:hypothetical protein